MHTRFSTRDRQRVAYDLAGPEDGPAVVLLHDLLGQRSAMNPLRDRLAPTARCVSVDLRGHGASATVSGASIDLRELALDVAAVLAQEGITSANLAGHGLGAAVALLLASERPIEAVGVVTIAPPVHGRDGASLADSDRRAADLAYKGLVDAALDAYLTPRLGPGWRDELPRPALGAARRHAPALATLIPGLAAAGEPGDRAAALGIPVSIVAAPEHRLDLSPATLQAALDAILALLPAPPSR